MRALEQEINVIALLPRDLNVQYALLPLEDAERVLVFDGQNRWKSASLPWKTLGVEHLNAILRRFGARGDVPSPYPATFAEALMFMNAARYPVCAAALGPTELIGVDSRDFARMLRESVDTCLLLLGVLSQRLKGLVREIDNISLHSASSRFASYLLSLRPSQGEELALDMRKGIIASRLSIKPETFSRIEKDLSDQGIIAVHGMRVKIRDLAALERLAGLGEFRELAALPCQGGHSG